jgi:hypothetical protein
MITRLEKLKAARDEAVAAVDATYAAAYRAELKKTQKEETND